MTRLLLTLLATAALAALIPGAAAAATCNDYANQADAQRAKDTLDGDGDGRYCERLPCPCATGGGGSSKRPARKPKPRKRPQVIDGRISSVVDGDTIRVKAFRARRSYYTVRLIGIDTPESRKPGTPIECGAKRATANALRLAFPRPRDTDGDGLVDERGGKGRRVTLKTDPTQDTFDRYGRLLAYVTTRSGKLLQSEQLAAGWARTYVYQGKRFASYKRLRAAESRARRKGRGVWKRCGGDFHKR